MYTPRLKDRTRNTISRNVNPPKVPSTLPQSKADCNIRIGEKLWFLRTTATDFGSRIMYTCSCDLIYKLFMITFVSCTETDFRFFS